VENHSGRKKWWELHLRIAAFSPLVFYTTENFSPMNATHSTTASPSMEQLINYRIFNSLPLQFLPVLVCIHIGILQ
jgi:hypothetical protein